MAGDPGDPTLGVDDNWHALTFVAGHFAIDEHVLQLLTTAKTEGLHTVSRLPPPDGEMPAECPRVQHRPVDLQVGCNERGRVGTRCGPGGLQFPPSRGMANRAGHLEGERPCECRVALSPLAVTTPIR
jgi:hypothetical protein